MRLGEPTRGRLAGARAGAARCGRSDGKGAETTDRDEWTQRGGCRAADGGPSGARKPGLRRRREGDPHGVQDDPRRRRRLRSRERGGREGPRGGVPRSRQPRVRSCRRRAPAASPPQRPRRQGRPVRRSPTTCRRALRRRSRPAVTRSPRARCSRRSSSPARSPGSSAWSTSPRVSPRPTPGSPRSLPRWPRWRCSRAEPSTASRRTGTLSNGRCARAPPSCAEPRSSSRRWSRTCPTSSLASTRSCATSMSARRSSASPAAHPQDYVGKTNQELGMAPELVEAWDEALSMVFATGQSEHARVRVHGPGSHAALRLPAGSRARAGGRDLDGADRRPGRDRPMARARGRAARPGGRRGAARGDRGAHPQPRPRDRAGQPARPPPPVGPLRPRSRHAPRGGVAGSRSGPCSTATASFPSRPRSDRFSERRTTRSSTTS